MTPSIGKLVACLGFFFLNINCMAQDHTYSGKVGKIDAVFTLRWQPGELVTGSYFCPSGKKIVYELRGENKTPGCLNLEEYTHSKLTAKIVLQKNDDKGKISWQGTMHNLDGRKLAVSLSRTNTNPSSKTPASSGNSREYLAILDGKRFTCILDWHEDGSVQGTISAPSVPDTIQVHGENPQDGVLHLRWQLGGQTESADLKKNLTSKGIVWQGWLASSYKQLILTRLRSGGAPSQAAETYDQVRVTVAPHTVWPVPSFKGREISPSAFRAELGNKLGESGERYPIKAVVESVSKTDGTLRLQLRALGFSYDYEKKHYSPSLEHFAFSVPTLAEPESFLPGDECFASVDNNGAILELRLGAVTVTHWRKRADGFVEVLTGHDRGVDGGIAVPRAYVPDRLGSVGHSGQLFARDLYFNRSFGLLLHLEMAGAGEMELESLPAPKAEVEKPWISVQEKDGGDPVPPVQRAHDAG